MNKFTVYDEKEEIRVFMKDLILNLEFKDRKTAIEKDLKKNSLLYAFPNVSQS